MRGLAEARRAGGRGGAARPEVRVVKSFMQPALSTQP